MNIFVQFGLACNEPTTFICIADQNPPIMAVGPITDPNAAICLHQHIHTQDMRASYVLGVVDPISSFGCRPLVVFSLPIFIVIFVAVLLPGSNLHPKARCSGTVSSCRSIARFYKLCGKFRTFLRHPCPSTPRRRPVPSIQRPIQLLRTASRRGSIRSLSRTFEIILILRYSRHLSPRRRRPMPTIQRAIQISTASRRRSIQGLYKLRRKFRTIPRHPRTPPPRRIPIPTIQRPINIQLRCHILSTLCRVRRLRPSGSEFLPMEPIPQVDLEAAGGLVWAHVVHLSGAVVAADAWQVLVFYDVG